ncbi:MAG: DUF4139 domain-containing protein [Flavobacteriales bacterium]
MKKTILTTLALAFSIFTFAQNAKIIEPKISDVTVFMQGAQITHSGDISLKAGENILKISDLPVNIDPNSIQVEGNPNYVILSVRHQVNYSTEGARTPRIQAIKDSLQDFQFKQKEVMGLKNAMNQEKALLENNRNIKGSDAVLLAEDLEEMANFYRERFKQIEYKLLELNEQEAENNRVIGRLQTQLNQANARVNTNPSEVMLTVESKKDQKAELKISYFAYNAGWIPVYDLRATDINSNIEFAYRAQVYQSTGNDWDKVNLTISTGNPNVGGQAPQLYPWYINIYNPTAYRPVDRKAKAEAYYNATPSVAYGRDADMEKLEEVVITSADFTVLSENTVSTEFKINVPYSIPSDNQQYDVIMQKESIKALYDYVTVPKLDNDAFLRARLTDWMQYSLLPGESNIYFRGTYVGKGYIDPVQANDTLMISLGRDRAINIKRDQIKEFCKTSSFGSKQTTTKAYEISITNTKKVDIEIEVEDQVPISQNGDLEVEVEEMSGGSYDEKTGKIKWKLTIPAGGTVKKQLKFTAKYPKKMYVSGL